jgi:membrane fusion protein (multidrug efflux system)
MTRHPLALLIVIALFGWLLWQFALPMFAAKPPPQRGAFAVPVQLARVVQKPLDITIQSIGTLIANESVILRPEISGRITDIYFTEGQPIEKGTKLFKIDDRLARAELKQAAANLKLARLNFNRFKKLVNTGAATRQRYDEALAGLGVAEANLDLARTRVDYATIKAPFTGVIGLRHISPGDYINIGQDLANFVSHNPMKVNFSIPETQAGKLKVNQNIVMEVEALPGQQFSGVVYALDPQLNIEGRSVSLRAHVPNKQGLLRPGYFARIALQLDHKESALTIPESAIVPRGDAKFVYVLQPDQSVVLTPVTLGARQAGEVEILTGLQANAQVVTSGQIKLRAGAKVRDIAAMHPPTKQGKKTPNHPEADAAFEVEPEFNTQADSEATPDKAGEH